MKAAQIAGTLITAVVLFGAVLYFGFKGVAPPDFDKPAPAADYYPLAVGDHWAYKMVPSGKQYAADVTASKPIGGVPTYAMAINQDYSYMAVLGSGIYQFAQGEPGSPSNAVVFQPAQRIYKLPFVVGDHWDTPVLLEPTAKTSVVVQLYGEVDGLEDVRVPAGTFHDCVRVLIDDPRDSPSNATELWFAPNVGIVKTQTVLQRSHGLRPKIWGTELLGYSLK